MSKSKALAATGLGLVILAVTYHIVYGKIAEVLDDGAQSFT